MPTPAERDERVSLNGLSPEEALRALLAVDPDDNPAEDRGEHRRDDGADDDDPDVSGNDEAPAN